MGGRTDQARNCPEWNRPRLPGRSGRLRPPAAQFHRRRVTPVRQRPSGPVRASERLRSGPRERKSTPGPPLRPALLHGPGLEATCGGKKGRTGPERRLGHFGGTMPALAKPARGRSDHGQFAIACITLRPASSTNDFQGLPRESQPRTVRTAAYATIPRIQNQPVAIFRSDMPAGHSADGLFATASIIFYNPHNSPTRGVSTRPPASHRTRG